MTVVVTVTVVMRALCYQVQKKGLQGVAACIQKTEIYGQKAGWPIAVPRHCKWWNSGVVRIY